MNRPAASGSITWRQQTAPVPPGTRARPCLFCDQALVVAGDVHHTLEGRILARHWREHSPAELADSHRGHEPMCLCKICVIARVVLRPLN